MATETAGAPKKLVEDISKTSGSRSKATKPSSKPADKPKTRCNRSRARSAIAPPVAVATAVAAAKMIASSMWKKVAQMRMIINIIFTPCSITPAYLKGQPLSGPTLRTNK